MTRLFHPATVVDVSDPDDRGRVRVTYDEAESSNHSEWILLTSDFISPKDNGWHGILEKGDKVIVAFLDYPENRKPFLFKKIQSKDASLPRNNTEILKVKGHKVTFASDSITIEHVNGTTKVILKDGSLDVVSASSGTYSLVRGELLKAWLENLFVLGNLGYPTATVKASGYPWIDDILQTKIKID